MVTRLEGALPLPTAHACVSRISVINKCLVIFNKIMKAFSDLYCPLNDQKKKKKKSRSHLFGAYSNKH